MRGSVCGLPYDRSVPPLGVAQQEWFYLPIAGACLWVGAFMLVDRWLQSRKGPLPADPLRTCIEASREQVDHQIWLLRNVLWWYLLPPGISIGVFFGYCAWLFRDGPAWLFLGVPGSATLLCILVYWGVYRLNQNAVRKTLLPRRQELEDLLASLGQPE